MTTYIIRRLLISIPVLFGVVVLVFVITRLLPGDPCRILLGERATDAACAAFNHARGLDRPIPVQFVDYLGAISRGDFGTSFVTSRPVTTLLIERLPMTVELSAYALLFATTVGILLGVVSAYKRNSAIDAITMAGANLGVSIPVFVLGLLLAFVFAILLKNTPFALPPSGRLTPGVEVIPLAVRWGLAGNLGPIRAVIDFVSNMYTVNGLLSLQLDIFVDAIRHMILPAVALGTIPLAIIARITRSSLLDVLGQDYVRTARAKGLTDRAVVRRHALPNAMLPMVTIIGLQIGGLLSGAVLTETIFNLPGVGSATYDAITSHDFAVIEGFVLVIAVIFLVINLLVDVSYAYLDPRLRPK
ncbi:MAG: peptide/nickel transport system permease protein [Chloroflexota bacterium]|nr:peptide/nickel transport system permease protein [Chloroflexota bacterium]